MYKQFNKRELPSVKDFSFNKSKFQATHKDIKAKLRDFGAIVDRFHKQKEL